MKHFYTKLFVVTFFALVGFASAMADEVVYTGTEMIYFHKGQLGWGTVWADDCDLYLQFTRNGQNATYSQCPAFWWDKEETVLATLAPQGTWDKCRLIRTNKNNHGQIWNNSDYCDIVSGKNYLAQSSNNTLIWSDYLPEFYLTGNTEFVGVYWGYSGNGSKYKTSAVKTAVAAGTHVFKLNPIHEYSGWEHQINYYYIDQANSNVTISRGGGDGESRIQFTLTTPCDVTIGYTGNKVTVNTANCEPEGDCQISTATLFNAQLTSSSDIDNQEVTGGRLTVKNLYQPCEPLYYKANIRIGNANGGTEYYAYDGGDGKVYAATEMRDWWLIPCGKNGDRQLYYLQDSITGNYMYRGTKNHTQNGDWYTTTVYAGVLQDSNPLYQWYVAEGAGNVNPHIIVNNSGASANIKGQHDDYILHRMHWQSSWKWLWDDSSEPAPANSVTAGRGAPQGGGLYYDMQSDFVNMKSYSVPGCMESKFTIGGINYYRMTDTALVSFLLDQALVRGDKIQISLYNDAETEMSAMIRDANNQLLRSINIQGKQDSIVEIVVNHDWIGQTMIRIQANENMCVAAVKVTHTTPNPAKTPMLKWNTSDDLSQGVLMTTTQSVTYTAEAESAGAISYWSSDTAVATVDAQGTVMAIAEGTATIEAYIVQDECYSDSAMQYVVTVTNANLQTLIDATPVGNTLTLSKDYTGDSAVISKAITIDAQGYEIGDLVVTTAGNLTLTSAIKLADLTLWAALGNQTNAAKSAQISGENYMTIQGETWFDMDFDPSGAIQFGWYTMGVPFMVDANSGVYYKNGNVRTQATRGVNYLFYAYDGARRTTGQHGWVKFSGTMMPGVLYLITPDDALGTNTFSFRKQSGAVGGSASIDLEAYPASDPTLAGWNGVANSTLQYRNVSFSGDKVQLFNHDNENFDVVTTLDHTFVMGSAFFAQADGEEILLLNATVTPGALRAPSRMANLTSKEINIRLGSNLDNYCDQLYISVTDQDKDAYQIGRDLVKMTYGTPKAPQMAVAAYGVQLCDAELSTDVQGQALFPLTITSPRAGDYTLYIHGNANEDIYLMTGGQVVAHLNNGAADVHLTKGTTTDYSLLVQAGNRGISTGTNNVSEHTNVEKIILNGTLYILREGKQYDALGR